jgi:hypothetical protein
MTIRKTSAWFVVNPDGKVIHHTCSTLRVVAIRKFLGNTETWDEQYRLGCRCVRLAIGPEMTKGGA